jgi:hypothetical protein
LPPVTISDDATLAATKFVSEYALPMAGRLYQDVKVTP